MKSIRNLNACYTERYLKEFEGCLSTWPEHSKIGGNELNRRISWREPRNRNEGKLVGNSLWNKESDNLNVSQIGIFCGSMFCEIHNVKINLCTAHTMEKARIRGQNENSVDHLHGSITKRNKKKLLL